VVNDEGKTLQKCNNPKEKWKKNSYPHFFCCFMEENDARGKRNLREKNGIEAGVKYLTNFTFL
jgi:hypothetical protein